jgi:hypothetical protein
MPKDDLFTPVWKFVSDPLFIRSSLERDLFAQVWLTKRTTSRRSRPSMRTTDSVRDSDRKEDSLFDGLSPSL